jgi:hypothetical protein
LELARTTADAGAAAFDSTALVVLTDGLENTPPLLADVAGSIDARTFAIGLGTAEQVSTAALSQITAATDGYLLVTGPLTSSTDSYFLLSKYFQQILVSATNASIITDPDGYLSPGSTVRIPFFVSESDIEVTTTLLVDVPVLSLALLQPDGTLLEEADLVALGATVTHGTNQTFARVALPLGGTAQGGEWSAVLTIDERAYKEQLRLLERRSAEDKGARIDYERLAAHGARYSLTASAWTNVRMTARVDQDGFAPGSRARIGAVLTEHGIPAATVRVSALVRRPDGITTQMQLDQDGPGAFAAEIDLTQAGAWRILVHADGRTRRGEPFTRDQLLTGVAARKDGRGEGPREPKRSELIELLEFLARDEGARKSASERGIDPDALERFLRERRETAQKELEQRG